MCLATNKRLCSMNLIASSLCQNCTSGREQTPIHMFYQCQNVNELFMWLMRVLMYVCDFKLSYNLKCIFFDNSFNDNEQKNVCNLFIAMYILTIWKTRKENLRTALLKRMIINKCQNIIENIKYMPNHTVEKHIGDHSTKIDPIVL